MYSNGFRERPGTCKRKTVKENTLTRVPVEKAQEAGAASAAVKEFTRQVRQLAYHFENCA